MRVLHEYPLGDMIARCITDEDGCVGFLLLPTAFEGKEESKAQKLEPLVQLKLAGDIYDEAYAGGISMRNGETVRRLRLVDQKCEKQKNSVYIETVLKDDREYYVTHCLFWSQGDRCVRISCNFQNKGKETATLEMFESFSLGGLSPYLKGDGHNCLVLHRIRSVWSQEGRLESIPVEDLQLEPAWDPHAVRCERFGQAGSMPVNKFFPFAAVEDTKNHVFWGAQIAHNASWQMELYRKDEGLSLSGGLADRELGHWMKDIRPGEAFTTPQAIVSVAVTDSIDIFSGRLTESALESFEAGPAMEQELPIVFNEYCTTWGNPSHENIVEIVDKIKDKGFTYFVIDCGWYKETDVPWDISMGDYEVSKELFPDGLDKTVRAIKEAGMIPGIWFEIENVGSAARAYHKEEHLLHRDGKVLTTYFRRFWDMTNPWVQSYLTDKVIGTLRKYGFGYMKMDYNETIGIGCDGCESLGERLRQNMEASAAFIEKVKEEVPGIILENCSSGGHRLEPLLMSVTHMASFSDAHECQEIPIIAANLHRVIHPAQSQIWAVLRKEDSPQRIAYSIINTFLGRMCISGDVVDLNEEQWLLVDKGMAFYKDITPIIKKGQSYRYGNQIKSARHPEGWQGLVRVGKNKKALVTLHFFGGQLPEQVKILLPLGCPEQIQDIYSEKGEKVQIENHVLTYTPEDNHKALAIYLSEE